MKDFDKKLTETTEVRSDHYFVKRLQKWIFELSGNVNVAMRLHNVSQKIKIRRKNPLCLDCLRLHCNSKDGSCAPNTNSFVIQCDGYCK